MGSNPLEFYAQPNQAVQDAYTMLTANIRFGEENRSIKTIVMTSCMTGCGKTATAINLAITMANSGWKILLVDTDMRKPRATKRLDGVYGLSDYLKGDIELDEAISKTNIPNFSFLSCGKNSNNPIGLICTSRFQEMMGQVRSAFDFVIFDTPSLSSVADASLVASQTDGTLIVMELGQTNMTSFIPAKEQLEKVNAKILGVVLNKVKKKDYMRYFHSYNYFKTTEKFLNIRMPT